MASESETPEVAYEVDPFIRVYKDGLVERLRGTQIVQPSLDPRTGVQSKDVVVTPETGVSARLYMPRTTDPDRKLPLLVYFHGGAFFVFTAFSPWYHYFLNSLAAEAEIVVVSIDYRRAPEHPVPIAHDDSWAALKWVASHSNANGDEAWLKSYVDFERVFCAGDSAGANIAHNVAIRFGSEHLGGLRLAGIVLMHPYFWGEDPTSAEASDTDRKARIDKWWICAYPLSGGFDDPIINPVKDPNLSNLGCSRVMVCVAEKDVFRDRGWCYCEALGKSGWGGEVEILESEGEEHVFHLDKPDCENAMDMVKRVVCFINQDKSSSL